MTHTIDWSEEAPHARVTMAGDFDLATRDVLLEVLTGLQQRGCTVVDVDGSGVTFVDASCLRVLHEAGQRVDAAGGALRVVAASDRFVRTVAAAGYDLLKPVDEIGGTSGIVPSPRHAPDDIAAPTGSAPRDA